MRIAVVQLGYDDDEPFGARVDRVAALVADQAGHDLVVLPELWGATGFDYTRWAGEAQPLDGPWARAMADAARAASVTLHAGSFVERLPEPGADGNDLANTSLLLDAGGSPLAVYRKIHRFGFGAGEPRLMEAGADVVVTEIPSGTGGSVPVGLSTCYDLRFPELYRQQVAAGAELFVVPAAWPAARVGPLDPARPGPRRSRTSASSCSATPRAPTRATRWAGTARWSPRAVRCSPRPPAASSRCSRSRSTSTATTAYREAFPVLDDRRL